MVDQFSHPIPELFLADSETAEWARLLTLFLDDISREDGALETSANTTETVLTQQEKLDLITVNTTVDINATDTTATANQAALAALQNSLPAYTLQNNSTNRTLDVAAFSATPTAAELTTAFNVLATLINDLADKNIVDS